MRWCVEFAGLRRFFSLYLLVKDCSSRESLGCLLLEPKLETTLLHTRIVDVACGQNYTLALDESGRVYSMGKGSKMGVLGLASVRASAYPILVEGIPEDEKVVSMSCGWTHVAVSTVVK